MEIGTAKPLRRDWQVTPRDLQVLAWLGTWKCAVAAQVHARFATRGEAWTLQTATRRLRAMRELGLVGCTRFPLERTAAVHHLTRAGMTLAGVQGPVFTPRMDEVWHDLDVVDLAAYIASRYPERRMVTEREIRIAETPNQWREHVPERTVVVDSAQQKRLYPDLVTEQSAAPADDGGETPGVRVVAHELERTRKPVPRLVANMLAYVSAGHIHGAVYWCHPEPLRYVTRAAEEANARGMELGRGRKIAVRPWTSHRNPVPEPSA